MKEVGGFKTPDKNFFGQTGLAFGYDDPIAPARVLKQYLEKRETPKLKAALIEGVFFEGSQLPVIASMASRDELIAGILGSLNAPISGIVGSINAVLRDVAYLVEEVAKKKVA